MGISDWSSDVCSSDLGFPKLGKEIFPFKGCNEKYWHSARVSANCPDFSALVIANALLTRLTRAPRFAAVDVAPRTTMERREGKEAQQCRNHFPVLDRKSTRLNSSH